MSSNAAEAPALAAAGSDTVLGIASYNIHECVGSDGHCAPERIAHVLQELQCDVIGLQEVNARASPGHASMQLDYLAEATGMHALAGGTLLRHNGHYGNGLLTRLPVLAVRRHDLSFFRREPRGALDVDLGLANGGKLGVIVTHLGLRPQERRYQVKRLLAILGARRDEPLVILGDINEWFRLARPLRWMHGHCGRAEAPRTFPVHWPLLALDRIWTQSTAVLTEVRAHKSRRSRLASDHLPIKAIVTVKA